LLGVLASLLCRQEAMGARLRVRRPPASKRGPSRTPGMLVSLTPLQALPEHCMPVPNTARERRRHGLRGAGWPAAKSSMQYWHKRVLRDSVRAGDWEDCRVGAGRCRWAVGVSHIAASTFSEAWDPRGSRRVRLRETASGTAEQPSDRAELAELVPQRPTD
jgi:hypothetical protein